MSENTTIVLHRVMKEQDFNKSQMVNFIAKYYPKMHNNLREKQVEETAELVKIDPKSIGVGQYQHDIDQKELKKFLDMTVESCVNYVGVELNTASVELLSYASGINNNAKIEKRTKLFQLVSSFDKHCQSYDFIQSIGV